MGTRSHEWIVKRMKNGDIVYKCPSCSAIAWTKLNYCPTCKLELSRNHRYMVIDYYLSPLRQKTYKSR